MTKQVLWSIHDSYSWPCTHHSFLATEVQSAKVEAYNLTLCLHHPLGNQIFYVTWLVPTKVFASPNKEPGYEVGLRDVLNGLDWSKFSEILNSNVTLDKFSVHQIKINF